jgi:hypothetical protein
MEKKNNGPEASNTDKKRYGNPIYYKDFEEMNKPLSELMEGLRREVSRIRGKLFDIKMAYGWEDRIDFIEGGFTCLIVAMASTQKEWEEFELKKMKREPEDKRGNATQAPSSKEDE